MYHKVVELQNRAVEDIFSWLHQINEVTFKSPTGSGKTYMIAKVMAKYLSEDKNIIFLVSSLSKGNLAHQNHENFEKYSKELPILNPYYIDSEISSQQKLYIPANFNVYSLGRDKYKKGTKLMEDGGLISFLEEIKSQGKKIILIKDECHQATNNLDKLKGDYFWKILNVSATPKKTKVTCQISESEAEDAKLIKRIDEDTKDTDDIKVAFNKLREIKQEYINGLHINPCLIIQISNESNGEKEFEKIKSILESEYTDFQWMYITGDTKNNKTNSDIGKLPFKEWNNEAKKSKTLDVIIFKMIITEGWDMPRACLLYQVRDSKSTQMDEQVIGRIRRNPILLNWEKFNERPHLQDLATTCWVWGILPKKVRSFKKVSLIDERAFSIKTTILKTKTKSGFNLDKWMKEKGKDSITNDLNIFQLYNRWQNVMEDTKKLCWDYIKNFNDWFKISQNIEEINKENHSFTCDYSKSMEEVKEPVTFAKDSYYEYIDDVNNTTRIKKWIWKQISKDGENDYLYSFDSEAEKKFAEILVDICEEDDLELKTWGKNFYTNSKIKFDYCSDDIHQTSPDFILKDKYGRIHIFEAKSTNKKTFSNINEKEYDKKIEHLAKCYRYASKITNQIFYIPILIGDVWKIYKYQNGNEEILDSKKKLKDFIKNKQN